jgi:hypothetical protein
MLDIEIRIFPVSTNVTGGVEFSEGASAKWKFDVKIEKLRAEIFLNVEKTTITLDGKGKFSIDRLRPTFYNFIFTFPELTFHEFSLAPDQNIDISAKKIEQISNSTLSEKFLNAVLLLTGTLY